MKLSDIEENRACLQQKTGVYYPVVAQRRTMAYGTMMVHHIFDGYYKVMRQLDCFRSLYRLQLHKHREPVDRYPADH